ncbi:hypothetical protein [Croceicoccus gelatinilyticus]|uniref:hypothetical protein n=1 Tax=Croceicoccus gelatinilyticus TaxID=2835536 RepID=UPI001BCA9200|nr:hypothetical protein [Croceicoccus gelatinilyticus]MBS7668481.1 hypothetical protein [Croceicoccus gelatinilyticus]
MPAQPVAAPPPTRDTEACSTWPLIAVLALVALQIAMIFTRAINWDEFFHFSQIVRYTGGENVSLLQSPFLPLFSWVPGTTELATSDIRVIRLLVVPCEIAILLAVYGCARAFVLRPQALLTVLAYAGAGYVMTNMLVLRADPLATALGMGALWVVLARPLRLGWLLLSAALLILALACTIKSVFYGFPILGALMWRHAEIARPLRLAIFCGLGAALVGGSLFLASPLGETGILTKAAPLQRLALASLDRMFGSGLFPEGGYLLSQLGKAPYVPIAIGVGLWQWFGREKAWEARVAIVLLMVPFLTAAIYRNSYPYNFVFTLAPAMPVIALGLAWFVERYGMKLVMIVIGASIGLVLLNEDRQPAKNQIALERGAYEIFAEPVTYIDNSGMVGRFDRAVPTFSTGWGLAGYYAQGKPRYKRAMETHVVPMVIANSATLAHALLDMPSEEELLPEDVAALRENYIPHWSGIFVAGKTVEAGRGLETIDVLVPGRYTVEGSGTAIDGKSAALGEVVTLSRGEHTVERDPTRQVLLRWGVNLPVPAIPEPEGAMFTQY